MHRRRKSPFIRFFDKTPPGIVCPHFHLLSHANGCPYDCSCGAGRELHRPFDPSPDCNGTVWRLARRVGRPQRGQRAG